jgi:hypothetical protein
MNTPCVWFFGACYGQEFFFENKDETSADKDVNVRNNRKQLVA